MGLLTFTQIEAEISQHLANRSDVDTARIQTAIDLSQMRVARLDDWWQLKFLVRGTFPYTGTPQDDKVYDLSSDLPSGYKVQKMHSIRLLSGDGRSRKLTSVSTAKFDEMVPEPEWYSQRMPEIFTPTSTISSGSQINPAIEMWPAPDQAYNAELRFQVWPRFLSDGGKTAGQTSDLELDDAIINLSVSYVYGSLKREDKAKHYFGIYQSIVRDALGLNDDAFEKVIAGVQVSNRGLPGNYWLDPFVRSVDYD